MNPQNTHRTAVARQFGPPEVLRIEEIANPTPGPGQVLVAPRWSGLNPVDARIRSGSFGGQVPFVPGTEFTGVVRAVGPGVSDDLVGQVVAGFRTPGSNADLVLTSPDRFVPVPSGLDADQQLVAAGIGAVGLTALTILDALPLQGPSTLVVHGGSGGVGTVLVQLAVAAGHTVVATASAANQDHLASLGAVPVTYGPGVLDRLAAAAPSVDAVIDLAGTGEAGDHAVAVQRAGGTAVTLVPETMQSHGLRLVQNQPTTQRLTRLLEAVAQRQLTLPTEAIGLTDIVAAHRRLDAGHQRGKTVLDHTDNPYLDGAQA